jgi:hypothetical protein
VHSPGAAGRDGDPGQRKNNPAPGTYGGWLDDDHRCYVAASGLREVSDPGPVPCRGDAAHSRNARYAACAWEPSDTQSVTRAR